MNLMELIEGVGFSTVCVIGLAWFIWNCYKSYMEEMKLEKEADRKERRADREADRAREEKIVATCVDLSNTNKQLAKSVEIMTNDVKLDMDSIKENQKDADIKLNMILEKVGN